MSPKKSLGQNFLTSPAIAEQIVDASGVNKNDTVLEIGPGKGILTKALSLTVKNVIAIEKDRELSGGNFGENVQIIEGDIRDIDFKTLNLPKSYHLVANIPYYITGEIIRTFLSSTHQPKSITILVQKEVAERIARAKTESVLSLSVKVYGTPKYVRTVKAGVFFPKPKVDSAILHIGHVSRKNFKNQRHEKIFFEMIKHAFNSRRKKALGKLKEIYDREDLEKLFSVLQIKSDLRPENISLCNWLALSREISENNSREN